MNILSVQYADAVNDTLLHNILDPYYTMAVFLFQAFFQYFSKKYLPHETSTNVHFWKKSSGFNKNQRKAYFFSFLIHPIPQRGGFFITGLESFRLRQNQNHSDEMFFHTDGATNAANADNQ